MSSDVVFVQDPTMEFMVGNNYASNVELRSLRAFGVTPFSQLVLICDHNHIRRAFGKSLSIKKRNSGLSDIEQQILTLMEKLEEANPT